MLRLYYLYDKSAKKSHELENIVLDLEQAFDLAKGGSHPVRSCGTSGITHKKKGTAASI